MSEVPRRVALEYLLAGALPGNKAGNSVSTEVMLQALAPLGDVTLLSHHIALPSWTESGANGVGVVQLGVQPLLVHSEAILPGYLHRQRLRRWPLAWVVNSRYAGSLYAAGVPYVIWEATTLRDELQVSTLAEVRQSEAGSGWGFSLHRALLPLGEQVERWVYERARAIYAMSDYTRSRIIASHGLPEDRVRVLPHPPSPAFTATLTRLRPTITRPVSQPPWRLLFVGRVDDSRKNFALVPPVLERLTAAGVEARLTVVGPYNERWRKNLSLATVEHLIDFRGAVPLEQLASAYLLHDLLLVPSRQEGFGIVVAEALSAGLPVIATRCGGPEQMIKESEAGDLVDIDARAMADAVIRVLSDASRLETMRRSAMKYSATRLNFGIFQDEVAKITVEQARRAS